MIDEPKLSQLLYDPQARVVVFGLAHVNRAASPETGAARLLTLLQNLATTTPPEQYQSWLADDQRTIPLTVDQVRVALSDDVIDGVALYAGADADDVAWQLAVVLPDLADAVRGGGDPVEASELAQALQAAVAADDGSSGPFGSRAH
jgi:uncharacterized protein YidB (DUF937 family)